MHNLRLQNLKYKHLIDDIAINLLIFLKFKTTKVKDINKKMQSSGGFF